MSLFPALLGGMPGLELTPAQCLIPIFNASQIVRSIVRGDFPATAFAIARNRFDNESVLSRS